MKKTSSILALKLELEPALKLELEPALKLELEPALKLELEPALKLLTVLEMELEQALELELKLELKLEQGQVVLSFAEPGLFVTFEWPEPDLGMQPLQGGMLEQAMEQGQVRELELESELELELRQAMEQGQVELSFKELVQEPVSALLLEIATEELQQVHGITLQQDDALEVLLSSEPDRDRALFQAGILLAISLVLSVAALFALPRSKNPYSLPKTAHLVAFLPEECAAEIGALHRRLKKAEASPWEIRLRLGEAFLSLLWVFYIQIRLANLRLPSGDRKIDD